MVRRWCQLLVCAVLLPGCAEPPSGDDGCPRRRATALRAPDAKAADGLWMIVYGRPPASESVANLLSHPSPRVRRQAALAAGQLAVKPLAERLRGLLSDEDPSVRAAAAWALGLADDSRAEEPLLLRVALDDKPAVRVAALRSLGLVGGAGAARALAKWIARPPDRSPASVRAQVWRSLALLARRGSTFTHAALPFALKRLAAARVDPTERRAAAYLVATLVQRYGKVRQRLTAKQKKALEQRFAAEKDGETRVQLGRAVIRLSLPSPNRLAALASQGGTLGRLAVGSLLQRDVDKGAVVVKLLDGWVKGLAQSACRGVAPVMLWQALGLLASGPRHRWLAPPARAWFEGIGAAMGKAAAGSCAAHQLARLACRAAALADVARGRVKHLEGCGGKVLPADVQQVFLAWGLARGATRRPFRALRRLWLGGTVRVRAAVLTAAGRLGGDPAHALVSRGLVSKDLAVFGAAATACSTLLKARSAGADHDVRRSCQLTARGQLLALPTPPAFAHLPRWLELARLVTGIADNAVVAHLKAAARHHHPTLRQLARSALTAVLGRPPGTTSWPADGRPPPVEPLTRPVTLTLHTASGPMTLKLRPDWAPLSAAYVLRLVQQGAFAKASFHRVVPGFVVQGGDPTHTGFGGDPGFLLSELSSARFVRGVVGLAHAGRDTESSQLFITLGPAPHLDGRYTAFAEITAGLELADRLLPGATFRLEAPKDAPRVKDAPPTPTPAPPLRRRAPPAPRPQPGMRPAGEPVMKISPDPGAAKRRRRRRRRPEPAMARPAMGFIKLSMGRSR